MSDFSRLNLIHFSLFTVKRTCQYKGVTYEVGDRWSDPSEKCVLFSCTNSGTLQEKSVCSQDGCPEELRIWDEHHCSYVCQRHAGLMSYASLLLKQGRGHHTCGLRLTQVNLTVGSCFTSVQLPTCEGQCEDRSRWLQEGGVLQLERAYPLCQESTWEERVVDLTCDGHTPTLFSYRHITSCHCDTGSVHSTSAEAPEQELHD
ncbi:submaxillary mucin-like protein [Clupea harengus]|uniref:Submaxillary mucin-like protein n=1 Tax=Clupea harengus TaxID=7950 RepID=A0A8M1KTM6_CLUHA|nr:submaxillary mucin-like protein [Clupea harengus]